MHGNLNLAVKMVFVLICVVFVSVPVVLSNNNEVSINITAIMASHETDSIDSDLMPIADEFKTLFSYSSYKKIKKYTVVLKENQSDRIVLPQEQDLVVDYKGLDEKDNIAIHVSMGGVLNTDFTLIDGGHILIGGPEYEDGVLVLLFEAKF